MIAVDEYLLSILGEVKPLSPIELPVEEALGTVLAQDLVARLAVPPFTNSAMDGFAVRAADLPGVIIPEASRLGSSAGADDCCSPESAVHTHDTDTTGADANRADAAESKVASASKTTESAPAPGDDGSRPVGAPATLPVAGDIPAGDTRENRCEPGTAWRIMTGAPMPEGADTVVKVEDTNLPAGPIPLPETVTIEKFPRAGANVRRAGEDAQIGDLILPAGLPLTAAALSSAVSVGYASIPVYPRPRVGVISTGHELQPAGLALRPGQIPDSNGILLRALVQQSAAEVSGVWRSGDQPEEFAEALRQAANMSDLVVTSGGVSAGAYDVVKEVGKAAQLRFTKVAMQPGKPQGFGTVTDDQGRQVYVANLPGNPVSVFVSFHMFVRPVLAALTGRDGREVGRTVVATAAHGWKSPAGKVQFVPVRLEDPHRAGETPVATPTHRLGSRSHFVASLHLANALAVIPPEVTQVDPWSLIDVIRV